MPELPEVEHAARVLRNAVVGKTVRNVRALHRAQRRQLPPRAIARLRGARILSVDRRGKHQLLTLSTGDTLVVHFRMTGDWLVDDVAAPVTQYARVVIELDDGARISLVDPRALSTVTLHREGSTALPTLGPDPTDASLRVATFGDALSRRRVAIKVALLDQRVLAGVGNIYAAEALWLARIDPRAVASSLSRARQARLLDAIRSVLSKAQRWSGGRYRDDGMGRFEVYDRERLPCSRCGTAIRRIVQAARSTYYCPHCQRR
jgi:formamidopyrimidine-DNA glycosylase